MVKVFTKSSRWTDIAAEWGIEAQARLPRTIENRINGKHDDSTVRKRNSALVNSPQTKLITSTFDFNKILETILSKLKHQEISKADAIKAIALVLKIPIPVIAITDSPFPYLIRAKTEKMDIYKCNKPQLHSYNLIALTINPPVEDLEPSELALIRELRYGNNLELAVKALTERKKIYKPSSVPKDFNLEVLPFETITTDDVRKASAWKAFDYSTIFAKVFSELEAERISKDSVIQTLCLLFELKIPSQNEANIPNLLLNRLYEIKRAPLILRLWPDPEIACTELIKLVIDTPAELQSDPLILELRTGNNLALAIKALLTNTKYVPNIEEISKPVNPALEVLTVPDPVKPQPKPRTPHPIFDRPDDKPEPESEPIRPAQDLGSAPRPDSTFGREMYLDFLFRDIQAKDFDPEQFWKDYYRSVKEDTMVLLKDLTMLIRKYIKETKTVKTSDRNERVKLLDANYTKLYAYLETEEAKNVPKIGEWYLQAFGY